MTYQQRHALHVRVIIYALFSVWLLLVVLATKWSSAAMDDVFPLKMECLSKGGTLFIQNGYVCAKIVKITENKLK